MLLSSTNLIPSINSCKLLTWDSSLSFYQNICIHKIVFLHILANLIATFNGSKQNHQSTCTELYWKMSLDLPVICIYIIYSWKKIKITNLIVKICVHLLINNKKKIYDPWCLINTFPGLHLVVVLTHKKSIRKMRQSEELQREVAFRARTDCVYFIENYTSSKSSNLRYPIPIKNDFETHFTVLTIIRQCLEFVKLYRSHEKDHNIHQKHEKDHASATTMSLPW